MDTRADTSRADRSRVAIIAGAMVLAALLLLIAPLIALDDSAVDNGAALVELVAADRTAFYLGNILLAQVWPSWACRRSASRCSCGAAGRRWSPLEC